MFKLLLIALALMFVTSCSKDTGADVVDGDKTENPDENGEGDNGEGDNVDKPSSDKGEFIAENWFLPYDKPSKYISYGGDWSEQIKDEWAFYKRAMIDEFGIDLATNNNKDTDGYYKSFSEGVAYGLIFSLYMGDQEYFNKILNAAEKRLRLPSGYYAWKYNGELDEIDSKTSASDAEIEIAYALLSAAKLEEKGYWSSFKTTESGEGKGQTYKERAKEILDLVLNQEIIDNDDDLDINTQIKNDIVIPGDAERWGLVGQSHDDDETIIYNPSYFMPAYMREFNEYKEADDWDRVLTKGYKIMQNWEGYDKGLAPDWCDGEGNQYDFGPKYFYAAQKQQYSMYLDGIRVPFRIGQDAIWFGNSDAREYCNNVADFINKWEKAGYYTLDGNLLNIGDAESDAYPGSLNWMSATYYDYYDGMPYSEQAGMNSASFHSLSMWLVAILGSDNEDLKVEFANKLKDTWLEEGKINVKAGSERMPRFGVAATYSGGSNHYFLHSLAMFGSLFAAGAFPNILDDLK